MSTITQMPLIAARAADEPHCYCWDVSMCQQCVCTDAEKMLRVIADNEVSPLTPEEKQECFAEIDKVEGYSSSLVANGSDQQIARTVLAAWADYARDKGML